MKKATLAIAIISSLALSACGKDADTAAATEEKAAKMTAADYTTETQKHSYALGASMGLFAQNRVAEQQKLGIDTDNAALMAGFHDGLAQAAVFEMAEIQELTRASDAKFQAKMAEKANAAKEENKIAGAAYLAENAKREGVVTTESGLQYEVLTEGTGASPKATDTVSVHYAGTLIDGTEFDSSYKRGTPAEFPLNGVIAGWTEGVQLMKEGAKFRFHIPSELAYGERQQGGIIGPNATLVFDVELLEVKVAE